MSAGDAKEGDGRLEIFASSVSFVDLPVPLPVLRRLQHDSLTSAVSLYFSAGASKNAAQVSAGPAVKIAQLETGLGTGRGPDDRRVVGEL